MCLHGDHMPWHVQGRKEGLKVIAIANWFCFKNTSKHTSMIQSLLRCPYLPACIHLPQRWYLKRHIHVMYNCKSENTHNTTVMRHTFICADDQSTSIFMSLCRLALWEGCWSTLTALHRQQSIYCVWMAQHDTYAMQVSRHRTVLPASAEVVGVWVPRPESDSSRPVNKQKYSYKYCTMRS